MGLRPQTLVKIHEYNYPLQCPVHACMYHVWLLTTSVWADGRWGTVVGIGELCSILAWLKHGSKCIIRFIRTSLWSGHQVRMNLIRHKWSKLLHNTITKHNVEMEFTSIDFFCGVAEGCRSSWLRTKGNQLIDRSPTAAEELKMWRCSFINHYN